MPSTIEALSTELNLQIAVYLRHHDLTSLVRTTKYFHSLVEPLLWKSIELHKPGLHRNNNAYSGLRSQKRLHIESNKSLSGLDPNQLERERTERTAKFLQTCEAIRRDRPERWQKLSKLTHFLCLTFEPYTKHTPNIMLDQVRRHHQESPRDIWNTFASFTNLQSIEIIGEWNNGGEPLDPVRPYTFEPMNRLRNVKLRGYLASDFVLHICQKYASSITHLDLGLLELPVGNAILEERKRNITNLADLGENEAEMLRADLVAPSGLSWLPLDLPSRFESLTHLVLCKPALPCAFDDIETMYYDTFHDSRVLTEWASLLRGVNKTLVELTLDYRTVAAEITLDGIECDTLVEGPGDEKFYEIVLPVLADPNLDWPALQRITLRGIYPNYEQQPSGDGMKLLQNRFPHVAIDATRGNFMFVDERTGAAIQWGGHDGLLPDKDELSEDGTDDENGIRDDDSAADDDTAGS